MVEPDNSEFVLRPPRVGDASRICQLVHDSGVLDANSCYLYLLLCRDFADTCVVAVREERIVGFVTAYRPPARSDVLFVWQVAVAAVARRRQLGLRMLTHVVGSEACRDVRFVEATVAPSNVPSRRLFDSLARRLNCPLQESEGFLPADFVDDQSSTQQSPTSLQQVEQHEAEPLIRIGPLLAGV